MELHRAIGKVQTVFGTRMNDVDVDDFVFAHAAIGTLQPATMAHTVPRCCGLRMLWLRASALRPINSIIKKETHSSLSITPIKQIA